MGMSLEEYWIGHPCLVRYYKDAYDINRKNKNQEMWLNGMYMIRAILTAFDKKTKYFDKPLDIYPKTQAEKEREKEAQKKKVIEHFNLLKQRWDRENGNNR